MLILLFGFIFRASLAFSAVELQSVTVDKSGATDVVRIMVDGNVIPSSIRKESTGQWVLDIPNASVANGVETQKDFSADSAFIKSVSIYPSPELLDDLRVTFQSSDEVSPRVMQSAGKIEIFFETVASAASEKKSMAAVIDTNTVSPGSEEGIDKFLDSRRSREFRGKPISLNVRDGEVTDVLRLVASASGFNVVIAQEVRGKVTLSLDEVPWDQVLDLVLRTSSLSAERQANVLRVTTLQSFAKEKQEELQARRAADATAPKLTKVFPISHANPDQLLSVLKTFISGADGAAGGGSFSGGSSLAVDQRTNSLIVKDIADNLDRMTKLIALLDTETPQVLVEAKVVEATESFSKGLAGGVGIVGKSVTSPWSIGMNASSSSGMLGSASSGSVNGLDMSTSNSWSFGFLPGIGRVNAFLNLSEVEKQVKIISSPRTVVANRSQASILQSTPVIVQLPQQNSLTGQLQNISQIQQANLSLTVTPTVTNDERVLMELVIQRDVPEVAGNQTAVSNRNINTKVLVPNGQTLVIGGIYSLDVQKSSSGVPWLRKIPIIGAFFGSEQESTTRSELFIFVTPRILNPRKSGLSDT